MQGSSLYNCVVVVILQTHAPGNKLTQKDSVDSGVQFITLVGLRQSFLFSQGPRLTFVKTLDTLSVLRKPTSPNSLNLGWKVLKRATVRLQPWFIIRRVSWLYIVAYTNRCHKDYKGDWVHRGLLHSFWRWESLVWNLVFISPGGQFSHRYVIPRATRHVVQSSLKVKDGISSFFKVESARPVPFLPQVHPLHWCPNHWTAREVPEISHILYSGN